MTDPWRSLINIAEDSTDEEEDVNEELQAESGEDNFVDDDSEDGAEATAEEEEFEDDDMDVDDVGAPHPPSGPPSKGLKGKGSIRPMSPRPPKAPPGGSTPKAGGLRPKTIRPASWRGISEGDL